MTSVDILFWLLIALLAGAAWAIESGVAMRHRQVLMTSTLSTLASVLFIMFWVEDTSQLELAERAKGVVRKGGTSEAVEAAPSTGKSARKRRRGGSNDADDADKTLGAEEDDDDEIDYSKDPFRDCRFCPDLVIVPKGKFEFGSPVDDPDRGRNEKPATALKIDRPFAVSRLEILRQEFAAFIKDTNYDPADSCDVGPKRKGKFNWTTPGFEQDGRHPVVCVSWKDASVYVGWLSTKTKRTYRLLNEVDWEYAAKTGAKTPYWQGSELNSAQANFGRSRDGTIPGGSMQANRFGLADVSGNVGEMISECDNSGGVAKSPSAGASECNRLVKGGAWNSSPTQVRHAARQSISESAATNYIGFRIARELDQRDDDKILTKDEKDAIAAADKASAEIDKKAKAAAEKAERDKIAAEEKVVADAAKAAAEAAKAAAAEAAKAAAEKK